MMYSANNKNFNIVLYVSVNSIVIISGAHCLTSLNRGRFVSFSLFVLVLSGLLIYAS